MAKNQNVTVNIRGKETVTPAVKKAEGGLTRLRKSALGFGSSVVRPLGIAAAAVTGIGVAAVAMAEEAARVDTMRDTFDRLAASVGQNADDILASLREMTRGTISEADLIASANRAISFDIPIERLDELTNVARAAARASGKATSKMLDDLVTGLARRSPMILDNLNLMVQLGKANEELAEQLNIATTEMTGAQQQQALINATMEAGERLAGKLGDALDEMSDLDKFQRMSAALTDIKSSLGTIAIEVVGPVVGFIGEFLARTAASIEEYNQALEDQALLQRIYQGTATVTKDIAKTEELIAMTLEAENDLRAERATLQEEFGRRGMFWSDGERKRAQDRMQELQDESLQWRELRFGVESFLFQQEQLVASSKALTAENQEIIDKQEQAERDLARFLEVQELVLGMAESLKTAEEKRKEELEAMVEFLESHEWGASGSAFEEAWVLAIKRARAELAQMSLDATNLAGVEIGFGLGSLASPPDLSGVQDIGLGGAIGFQQPGALGDMGATAAEEFDAFIEGLLGATDGVMDFAAATDPLIGAFLMATMEIENLGKVLNPLGTIFEGMLQVLGPVVNSVLAPLVGIFSIMGQVLGQTLVPLFQVLEPVILLVAEVFLWLYNNVFRHVGNLLIGIFQIVGIAFAGFVNALFALIRFVTFGLVDFKDVPVPTFGSGMLQKVSLDDLITSGTSDQDFGGGGIGSETTVAPAPNIVFTQNINGPNFIGTDTEELGEVTEQALFDFVAAGGSIRVLQA